MSLMLFKGDGLSTRNSGAGFVDIRFCPGQIVMIGRAAFGNLFIDKMPHGCFDR